MTHILIVEDEPKLAQLVAKYVEREKFRFDIIADGAAVMPWLAAHQTNLVLLDLNLPGRDGLAVCQDIRASMTLPVIITTARIDEIDRLLGLETGADDYVCKPYSPRELMARIKAVLRRSTPLPPVAAVTPGVRFDEERLTVTFSGAPVIFTVVEFQILKLLASAPGRIFSRDQLMDRIYPDQRIVNDRTIDSHIKKLRRKLEQAQVEGDPVQSVYGAGYRFVVPL